MSNQGKCEVTKPCPALLPTHLRISWYTSPMAASTRVSSVSPAEALSGSTAIVMPLTTAPPTVVARYGACCIPNNTSESVSDSLCDFSN